ncbi:MAG: hypothetical protein QM486_03545 [Flavobacteriaceae bacterium]
MSDTQFKYYVILFAEVIVPDFYDNQVLQKPFLENFSKIIENLEYQADSKIKLLVKLIAALSFIFNFKAFNKLNYKRRKTYIDKLFNLPINKIVAGLTGLRSLILISYYGLDQIRLSINYKQL